MALGKKMLLLAAFCGLAWGQTGLTTIQDTLFKADGTRFNGTLTIQWVTFDVNNVGTVVQQSTSVAVVNGNLQVQLAPTPRLNRLQTSIRFNIKATAANTQSTDNFMEVRSGCTLCFSCASEIKDASERANA